MPIPSLKKCRDVFVRHLYFVGPGLVSAVAYIDPGNWATDLEAGANYGYKLLFIVLLAGVAAVVLQAMTVRLGATTSMSLPAQTRLLFLRLEAKYPKYRIPLHCALWCLYILAEVAIIATDLAELLGSAIALHMLFPRLPLFAGVLVTAADVLIVLVFFNSSNGRQGMMFFEILIVSLVLAVFVSFMILLKLIRPDWGDVFLGFVPSRTLVKPGALYIGVGIIGATVMPHALFLGSSLSGVDRLRMVPTPPDLSPKKSYKMPSLFRRHRHQRSEEYSLETLPTASTASTASVTATENRANGLGRLESEMEISKRDSTPRAGESSSQGRMMAEASKSDLDLAMEKYEKDVKAFDRIEWVEIHLKHATADTAFSLLSFALTINSSILILAGAAFYYNPSATGDSDLQGAHDLIKDYLGNGPAIIFALALLCAGQSASITATLAGQVVSEGFINWRTPPTIRRLVTRLIGVVPAAAVAAAVGNKGLNTMLVASQVLLSIVLPTVIFPLVYLCSREELMTVEGPEVEAEQEAPQVEAVDETAQIEREVARRTKSFKSPMTLTVIGYLLFGVVVLANCYVIVELALGNG